MLHAIEGVFHEDSWNITRRVDESMVTHHTAFGCSRRIHRSFTEMRFLLQCNSQPDRLAILELVAPLTSTEH